ncbi:MAG: PEGA domain-containing protein [Deltaproteobacteria bacterium]|nr:PEGA domain-containing protein [Deltaproteobacteria bacterium]
MINSVRACSMIVSFLLIIPTNVFAADASAPQSLVVFAKHDGDADGETDRQATFIRQELSQDGRFQVVDDGIARDVISYHGNPGSSEQARLAREEVNQARTRYFAFQYDEAFAHIDRALAMLTSLDVADVGALLWEAHLTRGVIAKAMKNDAQAATSFAEAIKLNPLANLDPQFFSPSVVQLYDQQKQIIASGPVGSLQIDSDPQVAEVFVNGIFHGVTPVTLSDLPVGEYILRLDANRYESIARKVVVTADATALVQEKLRWTGKKKDASPEEQNAEAELRQGLSLADALKVDRVVMVNADQDAGGFRLTSRVIDREFRTSLKPKAVLYHQDEAALKLKDFSTDVVAQASQNIRRTPTELIDPAGSGDVRLLMAERKQLHKRPLFWGGVGGLAAGAIIGGILVGTSGGSDSGDLRVRFR